MKRNLQTFMLAVCLALAVGCGKEAREAEREAAPITITDDRGISVSLQEPAKRVVCLSPEAGEIICALGKQEVLVGVVRECDYPPQLSQLPLVGSFSNPSIESIASLEPDLTVLTGLEQKSFGERLTSWNIPSASFYARSIADLYANIERLGVFLGAEEKAGGITRELKARFAELERAGEEAALKYGRRRVFVEISPDPIMTVAEGSFVHELVELVGAENIAEDMPREYSRIDPEMVISADPQVIIILHQMADAQTVSTRSGFGEISAVVNRRIITDLDPDIILRASPRLIDGGWALFEAIYPEWRDEENN